MTATSTTARAKTRFSSLNLSAVYKAPVARASDRVGGIRGASRMLVLKSGGRLSPAPTAPAPINTPSLRKENNGQDVHVSLVPAGRSGWGSAADVDEQEMTAPVAPAAAAAADATLESEPRCHQQNAEKDHSRTAPNSSGCTRAVAQLRGSSFSRANSSTGRWGDDAVEQDIAQADMLRASQYGHCASQPRDASLGECTSEGDARREAWSPDQRAATKLFTRTNQPRSQEEQIGCTTDRHQSMTQPLVAQNRCIYRPSDARFDDPRRYSYPHRHHEVLDSRATNGLQSHHQIAPRRASHSTFPHSNEQREGTTIVSTPPQHIRYAAQSMQQQSFANRSSVAAPPVRILKRDGPRMLFDPKTGTMVNAEVNGTPGRGLRLDSSAPPPAPATPSKVRLLVSSSPDAAAAPKSTPSNRRITGASTALSTEEVHIQRANHKSTSSLENAEESAPEKKDESAQADLKKRATKVKERAKPRKRGKDAASDGASSAALSSKSSANIDEKPNVIPDEDSVAVSVVQDDLERVHHCKIRKGVNVDMLKQVPEGGGVVILTGAQEGIAFPLDDDSGKRFETVRSRRALLLERKTLREKASTAVILAARTHRQRLAPTRSFAPKPQGASSAIVISAPHRSSKRALVVGTQVTRKASQERSPSQRANDKSSAPTQSSSERRREAVSLSPQDTTKAASLSDSDAQAEQKNEASVLPTPAVLRKAQTRDVEKASSTTERGAVAKESQVGPTAKRVYRVKRTETKAQDAAPPQSSPAQVHSVAAKSEQLETESSRHRDEQTPPPNIPSSRQKAKSNSTKLDSLRSATPSVRSEGSSSSPPGRDSMSEPPARDRRASSRTFGGAKPKQEQQGRDATTDPPRNAGDTDPAAEADATAKRSERTCDENKNRARDTKYVHSRTESTSSADAALAKVTSPTAEVRSPRSKAHKRKPKLAASTARTTVSVPIQDASSPAQSSEHKVVKTVNDHIGNASMRQSASAPSEATPPQPTKTLDRIHPHRPRKWAKKAPSGAAAEGCLDPALAATKSSSAVAAAKEPVGSDPVSRLRKVSESPPSLAKNRPSKASGAPSGIVAGNKTFKRVYVAKTQPKSAGSETLPSSAA